MASQLTFLIASLFIVFCHAQTSKHSAQLMMDIAKDLKDGISQNCQMELAKIAAKSTTEASITNLCKTIKAKTLTPACTAGEKTKVQKIICDKIEDSEIDRADRVLKYSKLIPKLSKDCQKLAGNGASLTTWLAIETLCDKIVKTDKANFEKKCPNDEYDDLKNVVCGGASSILSGLFTLGLCLVVSVFSKV